MEFKLDFINTHVVVGLLVILTLIARFAAASTIENEECSTQLNQVTIWMIGILIWVPIFDATFGINTIIRKVPLLVIAFLWPIVILAFEMYLAEHQTLQNESKRNRSTVQLETNAISGLAFALGGLMLTNLGKDFAKTVAPILSIVILICLVFIIPNPSSHFGSSMSATIQSIQKVCLTYCTGLLIGAVLINLDLIRSLDWSNAYDSFLLNKTK